MPAPAVPPGAPPVMRDDPRATWVVAAALALGTLAAAVWIGAAAAAAGVVLAALGIALGAAGTVRAYRAVRVAALYQAVADVDAGDDPDGADADRRTPVPA